MSLCCRRGGTVGGSRGGDYYLRSLDWKSTIVLIPRERSARVPNGDSVGFGKSLSIMPSISDDETMPRCPLGSSTELIYSLLTFKIRGANPWYITIHEPPSS